ncbi:hypothetical protein MP228_006535 [Amoeboaphelidium protococcarum]|nr:hypothetical protein MP228_006535 [Amoeboaphelidium protococcarum]
MNQAEALLQWWRACRPNDKIDELADLADGSTFSALLHSIDPDRFTLISKSALQESTRSSTGGSGNEGVGQNWILKHTMLKRLFGQIRSYYKQVLSVTLNTSTSFNLQSMAQSDDAETISELGFIVLNLAIRSPDNQEYIMNIQLLPEDSQHSIMEYVQQLSMQLEEVEVGPVDQNLSSAQSSQQDTDTLRQLQSELDSSKREVSTLQEKNQKLQSDVDQLQEQLQNATAKQKSKEKQDSNSNLTVVYKVEIEKFKKQLDQVEQQKIELQDQVRQQQDIISELSKKLEAANKQVQDAQSLRDQVEEQQHTILRLQKSELALENLKKKMDDAQQTKKKLQELEQSNAVLASRYDQLEQEYIKVAGKSFDQGGQSDADYKSSSTAFAQTQQLDQLRNKIQDLEQSKMRDEDLIRQLQFELSQSQLVDSRHGEGETLPELDLNTKESSSADDDPLHQENQRLRSQLHYLQKQVSTASTQSIKENSGTTADRQQEVESLNQRVNQLLSEKDSLYREHLQLKDKLLELEKVNLTLNQASKIGSSQDQQVQQLQTALSEAQSQVMKLQLQVKESQTLRSSSDNAQLDAGAVDALQAQVKVKDDECQKLFRDFEDFKVMTSREQKIIVQAWYELGTQMQKFGTSSGGMRSASSFGSRVGSPISWMNQQRKTVLESPIKKRI